MEPDDLRFSFKYIAIAVCVQAFWIFAQVMNRDFIMNLPRDVNFVFGTIGNKNLVGAFFLMSLVPMYFFKKWTILLPVIGILYSKASASIFALGGGSLFYLFFTNFRQPSRQRLMKFVVISGIIGAFFLVWQYVDNPMKGIKEGRWPIWKKTTELMFEHRNVADVVDKKFAATYDRLKETITELDTRKAELTNMNLGFDWLGEKKRQRTQGLEEVEQTKEKISSAIEEIDMLKKDAATKAKGVIDVELIETLRNPWLGYGLGTFKFEFPGRLNIEEAGGRALDNQGKVMVDRDGKEIPLQWRRAHNTFLQTAREQGLIGVFLQMLIPGMMFAYFLRTRRTEISVLWMSAVVMICINAMGNFPDRQFALMYCILFTLAAFNVEVRNERLLEMAHRG